MGMTAPLAAIIVAVISAAISVISLKWSLTNNRAIENYKSQLKREEDEATRAADAQRLVTRYRDPLLRTAYDFQSRLYNILRKNGFRGGSDPQYFSLNTLFVIADFLGWLEIIRRDMQFLDVGAVETTRRLNERILEIQDRLASTTGTSDPYYLYRGQQRAIGELMIDPIASTTGDPGPRYQTIGFAEFCSRMTDADYARWFDRLAAQLPSLPHEGSERLRQVQHALIDLIELLDPDGKWYTTNKGRL